jgi:hypothetical protein
MKRAASSLIWDFWLRDRQIKYHWNIHSRYFKCIVMDFTKESVEASLRMLADLLAAEQAKPAWLVVCGGSALLATGLVLRPTRDVDVLALREPDGTPMSCHPLPADLLNAAKRVAVEWKLFPDWINSGPADLFELSLNLGLWKRLDTRTYGSHLKVSFITRLDQIVFKLYAAVGRSEQRDFDDLVALAPRGMEIEPAARWLIARAVSPDKRARLTDVIRCLGHGEIADRLPR